MTATANSREEEDLHASSRAKRDALRFLAYRGRSQAEVRRRLEKRHPQPVIDQVIDQLLAEGYLNDAAFAQEWRRHRERGRPRAQGIIRRELLKLGVDAEVVREALDGFDDAGNAYRAGLSLARRSQGSEYSEFRRRVWPYLQRRGFSQSVIRNAVEQLWSESSDPLHGGVDPEAQEEQREDSESEGVDGPADEEGANHGGSSNPG